MGCPSVLKVLKPECSQYVLSKTFNWRPPANPGITPKFTRPCLCLKAQFFGYQAGDTNRVSNRGQPVETQFSARFMAHTFLQAILDKKDGLPLMYSRHFIDTLRGSVFDLPNMGPDFGRHFLGLKLSEKSREFPSGGGGVSHWFGTLRKTGFPPPPSAHIPSI